MQLKLTFLELQNLIKKKSGKDIFFTYSGDHTVRIGYEVSILFKKSELSIDITVERIDDDDLYLSYSGGAGIEYAIREALKHLGNRPGAEAIEMLDNSRLLIHLGDNAQTQQLVQNITLHDIHFDAAGLIIDFVPKNFL